MIIDGYLDRQGRLAQWPKRQRLPAVLEWLAAKFEAGREYTEKEVNSLLNQAHTFQDPALLRRELVCYGFLDRENDGTRYRLTQG